MRKIKNLLMILAVSIILNSIKYNSIVSNAAKETVTSFAIEDCISVEKNKSVKVTFNGVRGCIIWSIPKKSSLKIKKIKGKYNQICVVSSKKKGDFVIIGTNGIDEYKCVVKVK